MKYFTNTLNSRHNICYITAATTKELAREQIYANLECGNIRCEIPMCIINKLVKNHIIGIDTVKKLNAGIRVDKQFMTCKLEGNKYEVELNNRNTVKVQGIREPLVTSRPTVMYAGNNSNDG